MSFVCEHCDNVFTTKNHLSRHYKTDSCQKIQKIKNNLEKQKNEIINDIIKQHKKENILLENKIKELEKENSELKNKIKNIEEKSELALRQAEEYRKIVEKAATKNTTTYKNYTHNNYLNLISQEPIRFSELPKQLKEVVNCESLMYDETEFHNHIVDNILKDENGKDKVLCTDINRKNFSYKDENSGELISDPELEKLREQLRKGANGENQLDIKKLKRDLLNKLIEEYDGTNVDPYVKFYEILKKLEFGGPFIEHVAKKTYVKSMSNL
jgi:hypothetical protein